MSPSTVITSVGLVAGLVGALLLGLGSVGERHQERVESIVRAFLWQQKPWTTIRALTIYGGAAVWSLTAMAVLNMSIFLWAAIVLVSTTEIWFGLLAALGIPLAGVLLVREASRSRLRPILIYLKNGLIIATAIPFLLIGLNPAIPIGLLL